MDRVQQAQQFVSENKATSIGSIVLGITAVSAVIVVILWLIGVIGNRGTEDTVLSLDPKGNGGGELSEEDLSCIEVGLEPGCDPLKLAEEKTKQECEQYGIDSEDPAACTPDTLAAGKLLWGECGQLEITQDSENCTQTAVDEAKKMCGEAVNGPLSAEDITAGKCNVEFRSAITAAASAEADRQKLCADSGLTAEQCVVGDPAFDAAKADADAKAVADAAAAQAVIDRNAECSALGLPNDCSDLDLEIARRPSPQTGQLVCPDGIEPDAVGDCLQDYQGNRVKPIVQHSTNKSVSGYEEKVRSRLGCGLVWSSHPTRTDKCYKCDSGWHRNNGQCRKINTCNISNGEFKDGGWCYKCHLGGKRSDSKHACRVIRDKVDGPMACPDGFDVCGDKCVPTGEECPV